jgi:DNA-3-methyladenine glycosylase II
MRTSKAPAWAVAAEKHLRRADPVMAGIVDRIGPLRITRRPERFQALVRAIIFQQLAGRAAQTIFDRFVAMVGSGRFPTPDQVIAAPEEALRKAGLSRAKLSYVRDLAVHVRDRTINFHRFARLDDEMIIIELTQVRGIGRWTAEMFLMFNLSRPDVLPVDDLGLRNAATREYGFKLAMTAKELREMGERWRPFRTAASWYLWQSARTVTPGATKSVVVKPPKKSEAAVPIVKRKATIRDGRPAA